MITNKNIKSNNLFKNILVSIGLSSNLFAYAIGNFDLNKYIMIFVVLGLLFVTKTVKISMNSILFFCLTMSFFMFSWLKYDYQMTITYLGYFLLYIIFSILSDNSTLDLNIVKHTLIWILFLLIPYAIYAIYFIEDIGILLGISYNFLVPFVLTLNRLWFNKIEAKTLFKFVIYSNLIVYSYFYLTSGNRGAILLILIYIIFEWLLRLKNNVLGVTFKITLISTLIVILFNFINTLYFMDKLLKLIGVEIYAIQKTINILASNQSIDSGRSYIINILFDSVGNQPLWWGKGIGYIEDYLGYYSHNIFIQYLFEGGIIYLIPFVLLFGYVLILSFRKNYYQEFMIIFTTTILFQLILSNVYWLNPYYWFMLWVTLNLRKEELYGKSFSSNSYSWKN